MSIEKILSEQTVLAIKKLYSTETKAEDIIIGETKKEFIGDLTITCFPLAKLSKKSPDQTANEIGNYLKENVAEVSEFNVIKGFLNIVIADSYWIKFLSTSNIQHPTSNGQTVMIEYSSPNTNKPLHLGHIRNNVLGYSVAEILKANGNKVIKVNLVNDRGIHICKSMLAWLKWGKDENGNYETPETTKMKGDHFVGLYYIKYDIAEKKELIEMIKMLEDTRNTANYLVDLSNHSFFNQFILLDEMLKKNDPEEFKINIEKIITGLESIKNGLYFASPQEYNKMELVIQRLKNSVIYKVKELLRKWEAGDKETIDLWKKMNGWVYEGFEVSYKKLGVDFDKIYYESETYLLGKEIVKEGLEKNVFYKKEDGSVWVDLKEFGLEEKCLLRADGTSVYITQDMGTAVKRFEEYKMNKLIYVVGNEQDHHFKVLFAIVEKLIKNNVIDSISHFPSPTSHLFFHLSYGMVDLPSGKMKSREGTVVDADDLMEEMIDTARKTTQELGKIKDFSNEEAEKLYQIIGLGALKYFLLKVDPKKRLLFNPQESIDFHGHTGPFIQYTHARIKSILNKSETRNLKSEINFKSKISNLKLEEKELIIAIHQYSSILKEAGEKYDPAIIANYVYHLAKTFNKFYAELSVLNAENEELKNFRLRLSEITADTIKSSMKLLGIEVPERM